MESLYTAVADVDSYDQFIPYCKRSTITALDPHTKLPEKATLDVGWGDFFEEFESILTYDGNFIPTKEYTVPADGNMGKFKTTVASKSVTAEAANSTMFKKLYTKWTLSPIPNHQDKCAVNFELEFCFNSNLYNAVSKSFGPKLANTMIKAFTERAKKLNELQKNAQ